jgi:hypothetical protein
MLGMTINALEAVFGDDDDDFEFNNWFKNWSADLFGGFFGDALSRGAATQIFGADLNSRMSLNDLWFRDQRKSADEVSYVQNLIISLLGPSMNLVINGAESLKQLNDGHIQRAMETASPAVVKNIMKGMRYEVEGRAVNLKGDELVGDVTGYEAFVQGVGFSPERVAQRQKSNIEAKGMEQDIKNRKDNLMNAFFMAVDNKDGELKSRVIEKVRKFNRSHPGMAIDPEDLVKSIETRYTNRAIARTTGGISIDKRLIGELRGMQNYGAPD